MIEAPGIVPRCLPTIAVLYCVPSEGTRRNTQSFINGLCHLPGLDALAVKRVASVRPVLDALACIGMAGRLEDGRYAA